jgi:hypothetical protein
MRPELFSQLGVYCFGKDYKWRQAMTTSERTAYVTRDTILKLLSDDEVAKVSNAEAASGLINGAEFLDLEHLDQGVQRAKDETKVALGHALPRTAVSGETWSKILALLAD